MAFIVNDVNFGKCSWTIIDLCKLFTITEALLAYFCALLRRSVRVWCSISVCATFLTWTK